MRVAECTLEQAPAMPQAQDLAHECRRLAPLTTHWQDRADYVVLDTAFEFGQRFLACWQAWRAWQEAAQRPRLHYIAFVPRFYACAALEAAHRLWPGCEMLSRELIERWPCAVPGLHRIVLSDADVRLTLVLGDSVQDMAPLDARIDAFLLDDGFFARDAKQVGHDLVWMTRLAASNTQVMLPMGAIDDAALRTAGFLRHPTAPLASFTPRRRVEPSEPVERRAIVIGAGLAGAAISERLCSRRWQVELVERHDSAAQEASGNLAGIFMPVLSRDDNPLARFTRAAFLFALRLWHELGSGGGVGKAFDGACCGVLQQVDKDGDVPSVYPGEFARLLQRDEIVSLVPDCGFDTAWLFAQGGWANPASLCGALQDACSTALRRHHGVDVARFERVGNQWRVFDDTGIVIAEAPHLVLANGTAGNRFAQTRELPLSAIRGQVTHVDASLLPPLPMALCGDGYVTPAWHGICSVGATYDHDSDGDLREQSQRENLARLAEMLPDYAARIDSHIGALPLQGRTGFRAVAPDRLPLVGSLPDHAALTASRVERLRDVPRHAGLYGLLGLASRGLTWAPLAAELLAAQMSGEPAPLERDLCATLDPARFALQQHRAAMNRR